MCLQKVVFFIGLCRVTVDTAIIAGYDALTVGTARLWPINKQSLSTYPTKGTPCMLIAYTSHLVGFAAKRGQGAIFASL